MKIENQNRLHNIINKCFEEGINKRSLFFEMSYFINKYFIDKTLENAEIKKRIKKRLNNIIDDIELL